MSLHGKIVPTGKEDSRLLKASLIATNLRTKSKLGTVASQPRDWSQFSGRIGMQLHPGLERHVRCQCRL